MRAVLLLVLLAVPAAADDVCLPKDLDENCLKPVLAADGDNAVVCYSPCDDTAKPTCLVIDPATGAITRGPAKQPEVHPRIAASGDVKGALKTCGDNCAALRGRLAKREELAAAVDPTGKLLFEMESDDRARGSLWSLKTGKRISRFVMDDFGGPPPPTSFDNVEFIGRHVFVGDPNEYYRISYDIYTGAMDIMFQSTPVGHALVIDVDGMGRVDLRDYAQAGAPIVATRRVKPHKTGDSTLMAHVVVVGEHAVVVTEEPPTSVVVDARKRKVGKPRTLPRCK